MTPNLRVLYGDLDLTDTPYGVETKDRDMGSAANVYTVTDLAGDGSLVSARRRENRTVVLTVYVFGADLAETAQAEAALVREADRLRNTLTVLPLDGAGPGIVFDTFAADIAVRDDDAYAAEGIYAVTLTIPALPFGRSLEPITVTASTAGTPTGKTITDCTATTGWASFEGTPTVDGGTAVKVQNNTADALSLIYDAFGIAAPAGRLLVVEWAVTGATVVGAPGAWVGYLTGYRDLVAVSHEAIDATWYRSTYMVPPPGGISINRGVPSWFWFFAPGPMSGGTRHFRIRDVSYAATLPHPRARSVALTVPGSARTSGTLAIEAAGAGLGTVLLGASTASAPVLALSAYRAGGGTVTADTACVSGGYSAVSSYPLFKPPAALVTPGLYTVLARLKHATAGTYSITVDDGVSAHDIVTTVTVAAGVWAMVPLGTVALPRRRFEDPTAGQVWVSLDGAAGLQVDEVWLVHPDAALLQVEAGSGKRVAVKPPSPSLPAGGIYVDGLDAAPVSGSPAAFTLEPGAQVLSVVTTGANDPELSGLVWASWLGHAGS